MKFTIYRIVCRLGEVQTQLDFHLPICFEHSLVKPSRVYLVIGVTNVEDYRPLSRDVTHDELRIWPPCWRENKKEQKKFLKKIRE